MSTDSTEITVAQGEKNVQEYILLKRFIQLCAIRILLSHASVYFPSILALNTKTMRGFSSILAVASLLVGVQSDEYNHKYNPGDAVQFYVHKVGNAVDPEIHIQDE